MFWRLEFDPQAVKELAGLDRALQRNVKRYLAQVCELEDPAVRGHGLTGPLAGHHRYRIGQLRIIARIQRGILTILVLRIGRRDSVY